jgi:hypothetical protein
VGSLTVAVGSGPAPLTVAGGLYLAGPYAGAPFSLVAITPALAGGSAADPLFDLGTVVDRVALNVDPRSGALSARIGSLSRSIDGIPLRVGGIDAVLDRPGFMRNPTRCADMAITVRLEGTTAPTADSGFRVHGCSGLRFKPRLRAVLGRGKRPRLRLALRAKPGEAAVADAHLLIPGTALTGPDGRRSRIGRATAWSELLERRLTGPVFLRSRPGGPPELVLALGPAGELEIAGRARRRHGGVGIDLLRLPDVELTTLVVRLQGGRHGLLAGAADICGRRGLATSRLVAYDGAVRSRREPVRNRCPALRHPGSARKTVKEMEE